MGIWDRFFKTTKRKSSEGDVGALVEETIHGIIERASLELDVSIQRQEDLILVDFSGPDCDLVKEREGQLLDAFQLLIKRIVQHQLPDERIGIAVDCEGFRNETNQALIDLAEKLKSLALNRGRSVYFRALPPKDRKIIHQYLADDSRIRSRSIGDGLYKKIKISPVRQG